MIRSNPTQVHFQTLNPRSLCSHSPFYAFKQTPTKTMESQNSDCHPLRRRTSMRVAAQLTKQRLSTIYRSAPNKTVHHFAAPRTFATGQKRSRQYSVNEVNDNIPLQSRSTAFVQEDQKENDLFENSTNHKEIQQQHILSEKQTQNKSTKKKLKTMITEKKECLQDETDVKIKKQELDVLKRMEYEITCKAALGQSWMTQQQHKNFGDKENGNKVKPRFVLGADEAGRGPLAGPVVAAACYVPLHVEIEGIQDSKKISEKQREEIYEVLISHPQVQYALGIVEPDEIDRINILQASLKAMKIASEKLVGSFRVDTDNGNRGSNSNMQYSRSPEFHLLIDGTFAPKQIAGVDEKNVVTVIKGDQKCYCVAAASIIAKVHRDKIMVDMYDKQYPHYGFREHKGYPTKKHLQLLKMQKKKTGRVKFTGNVTDLWRGC
eukprot:TRINITY_DN9475_c0_g1_i2.p1 TRINITY_DN9475_c0_g1~~TRINITY_DN9475_c0_g1_i2.p1  ORF type:complete len:434 (+),score=48.91 TRINITY_DN9475_c0_g1_i2:146-1447(+)